MPSGEYIATLPLKAVEGVLRPETTEYQLKS
jgi:hypothetical protein